MYIEYELVYVPYVGEQSKVIKKWYHAPDCWDIEDVLVKADTDKDRCIMRKTVIERCSVDDYIGR